MEGDTSTTNSSYHHTVDENDLPHPPNNFLLNSNPKPYGSQTGINTNIPAANLNIQNSTTLQLLKKLNSENNKTLNKFTNSNNKIQSKINKFNDAMDSAIRQKNENQKISPRFEEKNRENLVQKIPHAGTGVLKDNTNLNTPSGSSASLNQNPSSSAVQKFKQNLAQNRSLPGSNNPTPTSHRKAPDPPTTSSSKFSAANQDEILDLRKKLNEVTEKNIAWQKYNEEREDYVRGLFQKNQALNIENSNYKNEVANLKSRQAGENLDAEQKNYLDKIITNLQDELSEMHERFNTLSNENTWFKSNYDTALEEIRILKSKLKNSKSELQHQKDSKQFTDETSKAMKQRIKLLESNNALLDQQLGRFFD